MPDVEFGGRSSGGSFTAGVIYSDGIPLPVGRAMANGSQACLITDLLAWVGSNGSARTVSLQLGSSVTGSFSVPGQASDVGTGWRDSNEWLVQGGTARFQVNNAPSGPLYFGHGGGGTTYGPSGYSRAGTLGGMYHYWQSPSAPPLASATAVVGTPGAVKMSFSAPSDDGGVGITAYLLQWATNSSFTQNVGSMTTGDGGQTVTGLSLGNTFYFRVAAKNAVTDAAGTTGPWSVTKSAFVTSGGSIRSGGTWHPGLVKVRSGGTWHNAVIKVRSGGTWKAAK